ncbi:hypothetical protein L1987_65963 [Smallanthus sonchifolius]|uniref:Uncharacterized protein n=1 Tax=Smallanthus sonchifolius TaxID=185202 RepID=A0ACB9BVT0_9ASTR|nr:hypothetical protein L1987_65963 [Smallanthus sonchifolius]
MSDGGLSNEIDSRLKKRRRKNDEFTQAIGTIAVAQVCESVGFQGFQQSALDTLSDVVCKYVREIGKASSLYANLGGRTECNVFDIVQGLEDLNLSQGFVGASDRDCCFLGSGFIKDISQYVNLSEEIEETQILPDKIDQEQKVLDPPSSKLKQFQSRSESVFPVILEQGDVFGRGRSDNPFLVVPLQPGEKETSVISLPAKLQEEDVLQYYSNHVSELDTCGPENQEVKNDGNVTVEGSRKVVMNNRPVVDVKFHIGKKSLDIAKVASWFLNDEEEKRTKKVSREPIMDIEDHKGNDSVVN